MINYDNEEKFQRRLEKFKQAITKYQEKEVAIIQQKSKDEQQFERNKVLNESRDKDESYFHKKQKNLDSQVKIQKSRKINDSRMTKMKLRHQFVERVQEDIKNALTQKIRDPKIYRELLKKLITQGLIKMLEQNVEINCLKKDVALVKQLAVQCEKQFNETSTIQTKIIVNERQNLNDSDIGGIYVTSNKGRIVCNNTLKARLDYSMQKLLPEIRHTLFEQPSNPSGLI